MPKDRRQYNGKQLTRRHTIHNQYEASFNEWNEHKCLAFIR